MADLIYMTDGMFTRFVPQTQSGENAWRQLAAQTDGTGAVLATHADSVIAQLRRVGYNVTKAKRGKSSAIADDALLAELQ